VIAQDLAATETVRDFADVVFPAAGSQERAGSRTNWEGRTQRFARAVDAPGLVQEDWEILVQLAALLGHDLGVNDLDGVRGELERLGVRSTPHDWPAPAVAADAAGEEPEAGAEGFTLLARPLLLDRGTMLTGADDLLATARDATATLAAADAAALGVADGDHVELAGGGHTLTLPVRVAADLVAGVVLVPTNATDVPAAALTGRDGLGAVTLTPVSAEAAPLAAGEVA
jgi:predicted molibdopterin-dependent oxidoreductase YjgC